MRMPEHSPIGSVVPRSFVPINVPVPPNLSSAFGYPGVARHIAFFWEPIGDELCYDDGRLAGTGDWHAFLQYRSHRHVAPAIEPFNLGYSDQEADHWLMLDCDANGASIAPVDDARAFLASQHLSPALSRIVDLPRVREEIRIAISQQSVTAEQLRAIQRRQQQQLRRLLSYCDAWRP